MHSKQCSSHRHSSISPHIYRGASQQDPPPSFQRSLFAQSMGCVDHRRSLANEIIHPPKSFMLRGWKEITSTEFTEYTKWNRACHYLKVVLTKGLAMQGLASMNPRMPELSKDRLVLRAQGRMSLARTRLKNSGPLHNGLRLMVCIGGRSCG